MITTQRLYKTPCHYQSLSNGLVWRTWSQIIWMQRNPDLFPSCLQTIIAAISFSMKNLFKKIETQNLVSLVLFGSSVFLTCSPFYFGSKNFRSFRFEILKNISIEPSRSWTIPVPQWTSTQNVLEQGLPLGTSTRWNSSETWTKLNSIQFSKQQYTSVWLIISAPNMYTPHL